MEPAAGVRGQQAARRTSCSNYSRKAARRASGAICHRRCSAATIAMPTGLGDLFSDAHFQGEKVAAEHDLAALHAIPRSDLSADDQLAYDVFDYQTKDTLRGLQPGLLQITEALPMNHFFGLHTEYPTIASGQGGAAHASVSDYENSLKRDYQLPRPMSMRRLPSGRRAKRDSVVDTKLTVRTMIEQLDNRLKLKPEDSPCWGPIKTFPELPVGASDRGDRRRSFAPSLTGTIYPALTRMRDFLRDGISSPRARRCRPQRSPHEGGRRTLPLRGPVDDDPAADTSSRSTSSGSARLHRSRRISMPCASRSASVATSTPFSITCVPARNSHRKKPRTARRMTSTGSSGRSKPRCLNISQWCRARSSSSTLIPPTARSSRRAASMTPEALDGTKARAPSISTPTTCRRASPGKRQPCFFMKESQGKIPDQPGAGEC